MLNHLYPECCGEKMLPVWFTEEETKIYPGTGGMYKTGRVRRACSHFECPYCGHMECVDDTFDGEFYTPTQERR